MGVLRNLTASITSLAKLQHAPEVEEMVPPIVERLTESVNTEKLSPVQVSAIIWAMGELGKKASDIPELMEAVLGQLTPERLSSFTNKDLTNFIWACVYLISKNLSSRTMLQAWWLKGQALCRKKSAEMDLPMVVCALTQLQAMNEEIWEAVGTRLTQRKGTFRRIKKWGIAALSWSLPSIASLDGKSREMAEHVQQQVEKKKIKPRQVERCVLGPSKWM